MKHRDETLGWLYKLGWLVPEQLACLYAPSRKVIVGHGFQKYPSPYSEMTARRAIRDLEKLSLTKSAGTTPPWSATGQGRPTKAYALTRSGIEAGALAAGEPPGRERQSRGKYMRSMVSPGRINHALLRNELGAAMADGCFERGLMFADFWGEGGARLGSGKNSLEPDGVIRVESADGARQRELYVEADTGSQKRPELQRKVGNYLRVLIDLVARAREAENEMAPLPAVIFLSLTERRSQRVAEWLQATMASSWALANARRSGAGLDEVFIVSSLERIYERGVLAEDSCVRVVDDGQCSPLDGRWNTV